MINRIPSRSFRDRKVPNLLPPMNNPKSKPPSQALNQQYQMKKLAKVSRKPQTLFSEDFQQSQLPKTNPANLQMNSNNSNHNMFVIRKRNISMMESDAGNRRKSIIEGQTNKDKAEGLNTDKDNDNHKDNDNDKKCTNKADENGLRTHSNQIHKKEEITNKEQNVKNPKLYENMFEEIDLNRSSIIKDLSQIELKDNLIEFKQNVKIVKITKTNRLKQSQGHRQHPTYLTSEKDHSRNQDSNPSHHPNKNHTKFTECSREGTRDLSMRRPVSSYRKDKSKKKRKIDECKTRKINWGSKALFDPGVSRIEVGHEESKETPLESLKQLYFQIV